MRDAYSARLSGVVLSVEVEEVAHPWTGTPIDAYVLYMDLGDHPESGEPIVGRLYVATKDVPSRYDPYSRISYCRLYPDSEFCTSVLGYNVPSLLVPGVRYDFYVITEWEDRDLRDIFSQRVVGRLLSGNKALVSALKGDDLPGSDEMGLMGSVEIISR